MKIDKKITSAQTHTSRDVRKPGIPTRSDTNRAVQPQKMVRDFKFRIRKYRDCTICVAKTKVLISCAVTAQLICGFVFAYAKSRFSHDGAHISDT